MVRPLLVILFTAALLSLSSLCRGALAADPEVINGIAAVVKSNDTTDVITYSEVRELSAPKEKLLREQFRGEELLTKNQRSPRRRSQGFDRSAADHSGVQKRRLPDS